jgi:2-C-methyl-D-erythritol 4-phosphate cytidylyltransferase
MFSVILLAWWKSTRFWQDKVKALLWGVPLFLYSLSLFLNLKIKKKIWEIIIVSNKENLNFFNEIKNNSWWKISKIILWWNHRQNSVLNWVKSSNFNFSIIHNIANPFVSEEEVLSIIKNTKEFWAAAVWNFSKNTIKIIDEKDFSVKTLDRTKLFEMQTPQWITNEIFIKILEKNWKKIFTDDVSVFESEKLSVKLIKAKEWNFKITTKNDLKFAESLLKANLKIWIWHDSHKFSKNEKFLTIWWVKIEENYGFDANSDWDLVFHSICNAIWTAIWEWSLSLYADEMYKKWIKNSW